MTGKSECTCTSSRIQISAHNQFQNVKKLHMGLKVFWSRWWGQLFKLQLGELL